MAVADRIKETTTTTGTGTITLLGAATGFRAFSSAFADAGTVKPYYVIVGLTGEWEVGEGTMGGSGTTLARTTVFSSSNADAAVNFSAGLKSVFCDRPTGGEVTVGIQGTGGANLKVAHAEPGGGNPNAYYGIFPYTVTWTNQGTYYDHTAFYGWNGDGASVTEPMFGLFLESKFAQGDTPAPFLVEMHLAAQFQDGPTVEQRAIAIEIDRAAPHEVTQTHKGNIYFYNSDIASPVVNASLDDAGAFTFFNGQAFKILNYASGASNSGKGEFQIVSDNADPDLRWSLSGTVKARLNVNLATSVMTADVSGTAGGKFYVLGISEASVYQTGPFFLATGGAPYDGTNCPLRMFDGARGIYSSGSGVMGMSADGAAMEWDRQTVNPDVLVRMFSNTHLGWTSTAASGAARATVSGTFDTAVTRRAANVLALTNGSTGGGSLELTEMTAPSAGAANTVRLYIEDNGSGKTRLMALFNSGAAQQVAIEP